jgi:hypothetical protein
MFDPIVASAPLADLNFARKTTGAEARKITRRLRMVANTWFTRKEPSNQGKVLSERLDSYCVKIENGRICVNDYSQVRAAFRTNTVGVARIFLEYGQMQLRSWELRFTVNDGREHVLRHGTNAADMDMKGEDFESLIASFRVLGDNYLFLMKSGWGYTVPYAAILDVTSSGVALK